MRCPPSHAIGWFGGEIVEDCRLKPRPVWRFNSKRQCGTWPGSIQISPVRLGQASYIRGSHVLFTVAAGLLSRVARRRGYESHLEPLVTDSIVLRRSAGVLR